MTMSWLVKNRVRSFAKSKGLKPEKFLKKAEKATSENLNDLAKSEKNENIEEII